MLNNDLLTWKRNQFFKVNKNAALYPLSADRAANEPSRSLKFYTEKAHTRVFSLLKVVTIVFTFKNLLKHYAKQALTHGKIAKLRTSQRFVFSCSCHCCRIISKTGCGMDPTSLAFFPQSLSGMPLGYSRLIDSLLSLATIYLMKHLPGPELPHKLAQN